MHKIAELMKLMSNFGDDQDDFVPGFQPVKKKPEPKTFNKGLHEMRLEKVRAFEAKREGKPVFKADGSLAHKVLFLFVIPKTGEEYPAFYFANTGPKSKLREFLQTLEPNLCTEDVLQDDKKCWNVIKSLVGTHYMVGLAPGSSPEYVDVQAAYPIADDTL